MILVINRIIFLHYTTYITITQPIVLYDKLISIVLVIYILYKKVEY